MEQRIVSQQQAMKLLRDMGFVGISHATIKAAADGGKFRVYMPGKRKYYFIDSVIAWANQFKK